MAEQRKTEVANDILELRNQIGNISDQLCLAVKGDFNFTVELHTIDESIQKLMMLVNFVIDTARRALSDVQEKNIKLIEMDKVKSDFMANISHELRTPLTLILGPLESILSDPAMPFPPKHLDNIQRIQRNASRLYILVNDLLDFSKIEAGKFVIHEELLDVNELLMQLIDDAKGLADERNLNLSFQPCQELDLALFDRKMLEKIALNLISNALKFTPSGGSKVQLVKQENNILLTIEDTGIGIPASEIPKLFERFQQVDSSRTRAYEGTGIGLALINQYAELMQGGITVESVEGKGSKFTVKLPIHHVSKEAKQADQFHPQDGRTPAIKVPLSRVAHYSKKLDSPILIDEERKGELPLILIADDNDDMRSYTISLLEGTYEIIAVENGKLALEAVYKYRPQVVLSDVMMPVMDGYELTKTLKSDPQMQHIPIILITAKAGKEAVVSGLGIGADDYLPKPFSPEELKARVSSALRLQQNFTEIMNLNHQLEKSNQELKNEMEERKKLEEKNESLNHQLVVSARRAGMADIATSVLHNIGNALNSVNMSTTVISNKISQSKLSNLNEIKDLLSQKQKKLGDYLENDPQGQRIFPYLFKLSDIWVEDKKCLTEEIGTLNHNIQHIKEIVMKQNSFSSALGVTEETSIADIIEDALLLNKAAYERFHIEVTRDFNTEKPIVIDRVKLLQVIVNLIKNSVESVTLNDSSNKKISIGLYEKDPAHLAIQVSDNGVGILPQDLKKMFSYGFTTKKTGHGFGLHVSAIAVQEMGGNLVVESEGVGKGATFTLVMPYQPLKKQDNKNDEIETKTYINR